MRINGLQFESVPEEEKRDLLLKLKNSTPHQVMRDVDDHCFVKLHGLKARQGCYLTDC